MFWGDPAFPGKNRCPVVTVTTPSPCTPALLGLAVSCAVPHAVPCAPPHAPDPPILSAQTGSSFKAWVPPALCLVLLEGLVLGRDRMESDLAQPGARGLSSPRPPGHREIHVIDTDYEQDAIQRVSLHWQGQDFHMLKYFSKRTPWWGPASLPCPGVGPAQPPGVPTARSLEDEYGPGFWRFRELTADVGLYLVAWHGRCAKLLKEELI
ncbi:epididymal-specific lipocalin-8 isoform X2 [Felis catus]|uniref:epididymal-specific lipocalin-8 isoform X2 n=1 Tax=Felis catus TaxID=9685 RepID=UPI001D198DB5|nr:epididymal-specific lipocalin-8 isoform X2 [Felis catus]